MAQGWRLPDGFARFERIAGIDEVGRGALAGPVVAAAVILPAGFLPSGLADSKALSASRRESLAENIIANAAVGLAAVTAPIIDRLNIRRASLLAMARALAGLPIRADAVLIDGRDLPPCIECPARAVIRGDASVAAIAAASIVAKVARDRLMGEAGRRFAGYGFAQNVGYGVVEHRRAIGEIGLCPLHRLSFAPCRDLVAEGRARPGVRK